MIRPAATASHRGIPVSLEQADLERKLVASRRGGYCFEHNLLLASARAQQALQPPWHHPY